MSKQKGGLSFLGHPNDIGLVPNGGCDIRACGNERHADKTLDRQTLDLGPQRHDTMTVIDDEGGDAEVPRAIGKQLTTAIEREIGISIVRIYPDHRRRESGYGGLLVARGEARFQPVYVKGDSEQSVMTTFVALGCGHRVRYGLRMGFVEAVLLEQNPRRRVHLFEGHIDYLAHRLPTFPHLA